MANVLVIGAGAAGLMAAGAAVRQGHTVTVLEHKEKPAQKILVTGKGRCNVTNDCTAEEFLHHVRTNPRFLYSSLGAFPPAKTMELFEELGVELKVERGRDPAGIAPVRGGSRSHRGRGPKAAAGAAGPGGGGCPGCPGEPAPPQKEKARPGVPLCRRAGHLGQGVQGGCRAGGHRWPELPHHGLHGRRLQTGPAGWPHHRGPGAQPGEPGQPRPGLQKDDGSGPEKRQPDPVGRQQGHFYRAGRDAVHPLWHQRAADPQCFQPSGGHEKAYLQGGDRPETCPERGAAL